MPRAFPLARQVKGMSVLRPKGGADVQSLVLLKNGWVTSDGTMQSRPGCVSELDFPAGTVGVLAFEDKFHTFAGAPTAAPSDPRVEVDILLHPTAPGTQLKTIHNAFPFLGRLYVVAEFVDGVVQHYWDEDPPNWTDATQVAADAVIQPTVETGYYYENTGVSPAPAWQSNVAVLIGESRQPTVANGFRYEVLTSTGGSPATSNTEPSWPSGIGSTVVERRYITDGVQIPPGSSVPTQPPPGQGGGGGAGGEYSPFPNTDERAIQ